MRPNAVGESVPTKEPACDPPGASDHCPARTVADAEDAEIRMFAESTTSWDAPTIRIAYERALSWAAAALIAGTRRATHIGRIVGADLLQLGDDVSVSDAVPARKGILPVGAGFAAEGGPAADPALAGWTDPEVRASGKRHDRPTRPLRAS